MTEKAIKRKAKLKALNTKIWKLPISFRVPFDRDGNVPWYPVNGCRITDDGRYIENNQTYEWKENYTFRDTLQFISCTKGTHSLTFNFKSATNGAEYTMFLKDMVTLLKNQNFEKGLLTANWTFKKNNSYYGIVCVDHIIPKKKYKNKGMPPSPAVIEKMKKLNEAKSLKKSTAPFVSGVNNL